MSDSPLMNKMEALLKKHRGSGADAGAAAPASPPLRDAAAPPDAWLPVLTQVIERGTPPVAPTAAAPAAPTPEAPSEAAPGTHAPTADPSPPPAIVSDSLAEQLMSELAPRLSEVMEKQLAAELRKNLDQTVATLLAQLDVNVREIVRDAVADKLRQPRDPST
jgi:hypothetical protein